MTTAIEERFIQFAMEQHVLSFGTFKLKSGRESPYFFNAGLFNRGAALARLGSFYAEAIVASGVAFDTLLGPAYKGIPLVSATAIALAGEHGIDAPYAFNRKEVKDHGEGGELIGAPLEGRVLVIDDVITAGSAIREIMPLVRRAGAEAAGVVVMVDREERGSGERSAIAEIEQEYGISVISIVKLRNIVDFLQRNEWSPDLLGRMDEYRARYGAS